MKNRMWRYGMAFLCLAAAIWLWLPDPDPVNGQNGQDLPALVGILQNEQQQPIAGAEIEVFFDNEQEPTVITTSYDDGLWEIELTRFPEHALVIRGSHPHYKVRPIHLTREQVAEIRQGESLNLGAVVVDHRYSLGFWVATITFLLVLLLIAFEKLPNATAALLGVAVVFATTFFGSKLLGQGLYIFDFERALTYINWEVIFLVMGMMIVVSVIEGTGLFQWLAFQAYRSSRGQPMILVVILVIITSLASALLDNVTTMLLMVPITLEIAIALSLPPSSLLIAEVLASNISGIGTLIGTPTNILIGAYADISFNDFLINQAIAAVLALIVMTVYVLWHYRKVFAKGETGISPTLYAKLEENAKIHDVKVLRKALFVFAMTIALFGLGESLAMDPAVTALLAATAMLVWVETDVQEMLSLVDWTTLVFFMALFMSVGSIQEVGLISTIAGFMGDIVGANLYAGVFVTVVGVGFLSFAIASIPLTASMLPVVAYLSGSIPSAAANKILYYGLSMGTTLGGNGLLIGGEANLMTAGVAERAGYPLSFRNFAAVGIPVTLLTFLVGSLWLLFRFEILGG